MYQPYGILARELYESNFRCLACSKDRSPLHVEAQWALSDAGQDLIRFGALLKVKESRFVLATSSLPRVHLEVRIRLRLLRYGCRAR